MIRALASRPVFAEPRDPVDERLEDFHLWAEIDAEHEAHSRRGRVFLVFCVALGMAVAGVALGNAVAPWGGW